ncbi:MAG: hypothetical protein WA414_20020 [Acidobacteriaceae bacterium]
MVDQAPAPLVDVQKVNIDHVNVTGSSKSPSAQMWIAITPLLTVLITAIGIVFTLCFQIYQTREQSLQKEDSDWRAALEKVSVDESTSAIGAFEMQSFLQNRRYNSEARSIASAVLPTVRNRYEFDAAFSSLLADTTQNNQRDVISIASNLSNQVRNLYSATQKQAAVGPTFNNITLEGFVLDPDQFIDDETQSGILDQALTETWELDTVIQGLSRLWLPSGHKRLAVPKDADLAGIVFLNGNFNGVDFSGADMYDSYFIGRCHVENARFPAHSPPTRECKPQ